MRTHIGVIIGIACLSVLYTWPVFQHPTKTIPGVPGDNILFYWDLWRSQLALAQGDNPLHTRHVFYPTGQSLVFHTNSVLHAVLLYPLRSWLSLAAMYNLWVFGSFLIGGWGAFVLGRFLLNDDWSAILLAFVFDFSPFRISHLGNHMFLFSAHWLPFYILFLLKLRGGRWWHAVLAGVFLALTAWTDLHQAIHLLVFTAFTVAYWFMACARCGSDGAIGSTVRPVWIFGGAGPTLARLALLAATTAVLTLPLVVPCVSEVLKSADADAGKLPDALDIRMRSARVVNFLLPPARHPVWGPLGQENTELQVNMGFSVLALCWIAWRGRCVAGPAVAYWLFASVLVVALAMGPVLMFSSKYTLRIGGTEYNLPMPHALLDAVPGVNMARAPARFMGLGMLAIGTLAAYGIRRLISLGHRKWALAAAVAMGIEFLGKPYPVLWIWTPPGLAKLARQDGAVIDLPFGVGSALRQSGHMDYYSILYQTAHARPRVGGMISRCSDQYRQQLLAEPVLGSLLRIYEGQEIDEIQRTRDREQAWQTMARYGVRHALLRPNQQDKAAHRYLLELFPNAVEHAIDGSVWLELFPKGKQYQERATSSAQKNDAWSVTV